MSDTTIPNISLPTRSQGAETTEPIESRKQTQDDEGDNNNKGDSTDSHWGVAKKI